MVLIPATFGGKEIPIIMKKAFFASFVALALSACSGYSEDPELAGEELETEELGELEQEMSAPTSPSFALGTRTGSTRQKCDKTTAGQVCVIPPAKTLKTCIYQANFLNLPSLPINFTDAEEARYRAAITSLDTIAGWTFTQAAKGTDCLGTAQDIVVMQASVGSSGSASNDVKDYGIPHWVTPGGSAGGLVNLTESAGVAGSYQRWTVCRALVDTVDAYAKGPSAAADARLMDHAGIHAIEGCLGIAGRSGFTGGAGPASRNAFEPATTATTITSGESCMLAGFSAVNPNNWGNSGTCPND